jgi:hypothetical protein
MTNAKAKLLRCIHGRPYYQCDLQRFMTKRMGAKTIEVKASPVSLISQPDAIAGLIVEAAGQK